MVKVISPFAGTIIMLENGSRPAPCRPARPASAPRLRPVGGGGDSSGFYGEKGSHLSQVLADSVTEQAERIASLSRELAKARSQIWSQKEELKAREQDYAGLLNRFLDERSVWERICGDLQEKSSSLG